MELAMEQQRRRIPVIGGDQPLCISTSPILERQEFYVTGIPDATDSLAAPKERTPDLRLLALGVATSGLELCHCIREQCITPLMVLSPADGEQFTSVALDAGTDGYPAIPCAAGMLTARSCFRCNNYRRARQRPGDVETSYLLAAKAFISRSLS